MSREGLTGLLVRTAIRISGWAARMASKGFDDAGVDIGVVEFVDAVVVEEEGQGFGDVLFVVDVAFGVAEGAADEHGGAVADVAGDDGVGELRLAEVGEHGVDGVAEVDAGVDEGAVEIEDEEAGRWGGSMGQSVFEKKDSGWAVPCFRCCED